MPSFEASGTRTGGGDSAITPGPGPAPAARGPASMFRHLALEVDVGPGLGGYGLPGPRGRGVVTPYAGLGLATEESRTWRAVARWRIGADASLNLEGTQSEGRDRPGIGARVRAAASVALVGTCERSRWRAAWPGVPAGKGSFGGLGGPSAGSLAGGRFRRSRMVNAVIRGRWECGPGGDSATSRGPEPAAAARDPAPIWRQLASRRASLAHGGGLAPRERRSVRETGRLWGREGRATGVRRGRTLRPVMARDDRGEEAEDPSNPMELDLHRLDVARARRVGGRDAPAGRRARRPRAASGVLTPRSRPALNRPHRAMLRPSPRTPGRVPPWNEWEPEPAR